MSMLPSSLISTGNEVTRIFHIESDGDILVMVHSPFSGTVEVTLNGLLEKCIEESPGVYWFAKRGPKKYVLRITSTSNWLAQTTGIGCTYSYSLQVNGQSVPENMERLTLSTEIESSSGLRVTQRVSAGGNSQTQWYLVEWPERNVYVHRRYKEFFYLYSQILSAYRGTHLLSSVPEPPPKEGLSSLVLTPKQQAANVAFLSTRQSQLEVFLKRVAVFPGVGLGRNPDFLDFLGISARGLVEHSVVFNEGPIGIKLKQMAKDTKNAFCAQVSDVFANSQGANGMLNMGDIIYRVGGEPAFDYEEVSRALGNAELRPIVVHFLCCNLSANSTTGEKKAVSTEDKSNNHHQPVAGAAADKQEGAGFNPLLDNEEEELN